MLVFRMLARYPFAKYSLVGSTAWAIACYAYFRNNYDSKSKWIWQPFNQTQKQMFYAETTAAIRNCTRETTTSLILSDINNLWNTCSSRIHSLFFSTLETVTQMCFYVRGDAISHQTEWHSANVIPFNFIFYVEWLATMQQIIWKLYWSNISESGNLNDCLNGSIR